MQETQEMQVLSLGREDPLEKEMATHSNILAWEIPWTEEPGELQYMESQRVGHDWTHNTPITVKFHTRYNKLMEALGRGLVLKGNSYDH